MTTSLKTLRQRFNKDRDDSKKDGKDSPKGGQLLNAAAEEVSDMLHSAIPL